ncbi:MAG: hypothetical protein HY874_09740 [Chloroflexi bacterium]|nr:hypothetical protein [Chloroflexota bacterium]
MSPKWVRGGERPRAQPGVILQLRPYELHGTRYYAVAYRLDADPADAAREARVSFDMIYDGAQPGDRILIESVLGVVDRIAADRETTPE